jgi:dolichyl-phosphate-mannose--protein O-mannosyl transferase
MSKNLKLISLIVIFTGLLLNQINTIRLFIGDEPVYAEGLTQLIRGSISNSNHPLFVRSILAMIVKIFWIITQTDMAFFWRIGIVSFAIGCVIVFYKLCEKFISSKISLAAVLFLILEPTFFVFSRTLHLEIPAIFFLLCSLFFFLSYKSNLNRKYYIYSLVSLGLLFSSKISPLIITVILYCIWPLSKLHLSRLNRTLIALFVLPITYFIGNLFFFIYPDNPFNKNFITYTSAIAKTFIQGKSEETPSYVQTSEPESWYTIPQIQKVFRIEEAENMVRGVVLVQNPITFLLSIPTLLYMIFKWKDVDNNIKFLFLVFVFNYSIFFLNIRETFYYYTTALNVLLILLITSVISSVGSRRLISSLLVTISILCFGTLYPMLTGIPISQDHEKNIMIYSLYKYLPLDSPFCRDC